jgi:lipopolysaccharide transport protein LptA
LNETLRATAPERAAFRVVSPEGSTRRIEAIDVRNMAETEGANFVVVGTWRPDPKGGGRAADVELRSGHSGAAARRYVVNFQNDGMSIDEEAERVAQQILQDLDSTRTQASAPAVSAEGEAPPAPSSDKPAGKRTDFLSVSRDQPIEINSEELELKAVGDAKHLIFTKGVRVVQGDMHLYAGRIEAIYPNGASQPDRLNASQQVRVIEGDIEVHCLEATYLRNEEIVICRGEALLVQGCDEVRGNEIEFLIREERVKVTGAASVVLRFDLEDATSCDDSAVAG